LCKIWHYSGKTGILKTRKYVFEPIDGIEYSPIFASSENSPLSEKLFISF
jgi:hypothetical protein